MIETCRLKNVVTFTFLLFGTNASFVSQSYIFRKGHGSGSVILSEEVCL